MSRRIEDIEARIAEAEKACEAKYARESRLLKATNEFYAEREKVEVQGLEALAKKAGIQPADLQKFFAAQEDEARRRIEAVTPLLQLSDREIALIDDERRAIALIDPCGLVPAHSPEWKCAHLAISCNSQLSKTPDAAASCTCTPAWNNNDCNPLVRALGKGTNGLRTATVHCWCWFDIPVRTVPANVHVRVPIYVDGFYVLRSATGSASVRLTLRAEGWQYGYSWAQDTRSVLNLSGDTMGRYDDHEILEFLMPVGADPWQVRVSAKLTATAKGGGALAEGNFQTGAGNYIKICWANTLA
jgi:hypothetical protein